MIVTIDLKGETEERLMRMAQQRRWSKRQTCTVLIEDALQMLASNDLNETEHSPRIFVTETEDSAP